MKPEVLIGAVEDVVDSTGSYSSILKMPIHKLSQGRLPGFGARNSLENLCLSRSRVPQKKICTSLLFFNFTRHANDKNIDFNEYINT